MCRLCTEEGRFENCGACRARTGMGRFSQRRDNWTFEGVMRHAYAAYRQNFVSLTLAMVILFAVVIAMNAVGAGVQAALGEGDFGPVSMALFIVQTVIQGVLTLGLLSMSLSAARGEGASLNQLASGIRLVGGWLVQMLLAYLPVALVAGLGAAIMALFQFNLTNMTMLAMVGALALLAVPALVYFFLGVAFANTELVAEPKLGGVAALRNSLRIARGQRTMIFGCVMIISVVCMVGVMACLIGVLFAASYSAVLLATLYLALRNGTEGLEAA